MYVWYFSTNVNSSILYSPSKTLYSLLSLYTFLLFPIKFNKSFYGTYIKHFRLRYSAMKIPADFSTTRAFARLSALLPSLWCAPRYTTNLSQNRLWMLDEFCEKQNYARSVSIASRGATTRNIGLEAF